MHNYYNAVHNIKTVNSVIYMYIYIYIYNYIHVYNSKR